MKRVLLFKLVTVILFISVLLPLASFSRASPEEVTIEMWDGLGGGDGYVMDMLVNEFNDRFAGKIKVVRVMQGPWDQVYAKVTAAYKAGAGLPDLIIMHITEIPIFAGNAVKEIDDLVSKYNIDLNIFDQKILEGCRWEGKLYCLPWDLHPYGMYINVDIFKEYKIPIPKSFEIDSLDKLLEFLRMIKEKVKGTEIWPTAIENAGWGGVWQWYSFINGSFLTPDLKKPDMRRPDILAAFKFLETLSREELAPQELDYVTMIDMFGGGEIAVLIHGPWLQATWDQIPGLSYAVIPVKLNLWASSHYIFFTKANGEERTKAAVEFVKWLLRPENNGRWGQYAGHVPATKAGRTYPPYTSIPARLGFAKQADSGYWHYLPLHIGIWEMHTKCFLPSIQKLMRLEITAEEAVSETEACIAEVLATYKE